MIDKKIPSYEDLLKKIKNLSQNEIVKDPAWNFIYNDKLLIFELLKNKDFFHLDKIEQQLLKDPFIALFIMNNRIPDINKISSELWKSESFICSVLENNYSHIQYIPKQYLTNNILLWFCFNFSHQNILSFLPENLLTSEMAGIIIEKNPLHYSKLPTRFKNNIEIFERAKESVFNKIFLDAGEHIKSNPFIAQKVLKQKPELYSSISDSLKTADFFLRQLPEIPTLLKYAPDNIKDNELCVWKSVDILPLNLFFASERLLSLPTFAQQICKNLNVEQIKNTFSFWKEPVISNEELILELLPKLSEAKCLDFISVDLKSNKIFMNKALAYDWKNVSQLTFPLNQDFDYIFDFYEELKEQNNNELLGKRVYHYFQYIPDESFEKVDFLIQIYDKFKSDFNHFIYPIIKNKKSIYINELNDAVNSRDNGIDTYFEKLKLYNILNKNLATHQNHHDVHKI